MTARKQGRPTGRPTEGQHDGLNEDQRRAVEAADGPMIIVAGPGSGKTRVLTRRIAEIVRQRRARPEQIVAITFTNRAANELRDRVERVTPGGKGVSASTFHRFCGRLIRSRPAAAGLNPRFTIYDREDQTVLAKRIIELSGLRDLEMTHGDLLRAVGYAKANLLDASAFAAVIAAGGYSGPDGDIMELMVEPYAAYEREMRICDAIDLDEMIVAAVRMLEGSRAMLESCRVRYRHIMIDEFQDTNHAQYRLGQLLAGPDGSLCVVGDPDQSIYGWRHADIGNILNFRRDYPGATEVKLGANYRSTGAIVRAAGEMIRQNQKRIDNPLRAVNPHGRAVEAYTCEDERREAAVAIHWMGEARAALRTTLQECAVMYRTHRNGRAVEEECVRAQVPYRVLGGPRFYDRAEIRDCLAYLRLVQNPGDGAAFQRVINRPSRGLGAVSVKKLTEWADRNEQTFMQALTTATLSLGPEAGAIGLTRRATTAAGNFGGLVRRLTDASRRASLTHLFDLMIEESGLEAAIRADEDGPNRWENVLELRVACAQHDDGNQASQGPLNSLLETVALVTQADESDERGTVTLTTLHQAKGLEFDVVALTGLEEGTLPLRRAEDSEEERRLCYVGMTRAKRRLALTWAQERGYREMVPSRFLDEIPDLDWQVA